MSMAMGAGFSHGAAALPPPLPCWGPLQQPPKLRSPRAARAEAPEPVSISTAASPVRLLPGEMYWCEDSML